MESWKVRLHSLIKQQKRDNACFPQNDHYPLFKHTKKRPFGHVTWFYRDFVCHWPHEMRYLMSHDGDYADVPSGSFPNIVSCMLMDKTADQDWVSLNQRGNSWVTLMSMRAAGVSQREDMKIFIISLKGGESSKSPLAIAVSNQLVFCPKMFLPSKKAENVFIYIFSLRVRGVWNTCAFFAHIDLFPTSKYSAAVVQPSPICSYFVGIMSCQLSH